MLKSMSFIAATVAVAVPAAAQTTVQAQPVPAATAKSDVHKLVCKREEQIGSRLGAKKVCLTVEEWEARRLADRGQLEDVQAGSRTRCSNDNGCPTGSLWDPH